MILSKSNVSSKLSRGSLVIDPYDNSSLGEHDYTLHMGSTIYKPVTNSKGALDIKNIEEVEKTNVPATAGINLEAGKVYWLETRESIKNRASILMVTLVQNLSRYGISYNGGIIDTGYHGKLLIPIVPLVPVKIYFGAPFVRLSVLDSGGAAKKSYDGVFNHANPQTKKLNVGFKE